MCHDRRRTGTGAAAHAGGDEGHVRALQEPCDVVQRLFGGGAADFRLRSRTKAARDGLAELYLVFTQRTLKGLCVGVAHDELATLQACADHVVDCVSAGSADA